MLANGQVTVVRNRAHIGLALTSSLSLLLLLVAKPSIRPTRVEHGPQRHQHPNI